MDSPHPLGQPSQASGGGRIPGTPDQPAFWLSHAEPPVIPVLIAVPHAGRCYPAPLTARMRNPAEAALRLEDRLVDVVATDVARETGAALLVAHAPRAMIDLNRAPDDMDWSMVADPDHLAGDAARRASTSMPGRRARGGLGLVPRRLAGLGELWRTRLEAADLETRITDIYQPYHRQLGQSLETLRDRWGGALLIDLHSMPPLGPKTGVGAAPDIVLGDRFGAACAPALSAAAIEHFTGAGYRVSHNRPYAGGYVIERHAAPLRGIHAVQVELCRASYLDTQLRETGAGLAAMVQALAGLVRRLAGEVSVGPSFAEAAE